MLAGVHLGCKDDNYGEMIWWMVERCSGLMEEREC